MLLGRLSIHILAQNILEKTYRIYREDSTDPVSNRKTCNFLWFFKALLPQANINNITTPLPNKHLGNLDEFTCTSTRSPMSFGREFVLKLKFNLPFCWLFCFVGVTLVSIIPTPKCLEHFGGKLFLLSPAFFGGVSPAVARSLGHIFRPETSSYRSRCLVKHPRIPWIPWSVTSPQKTATSICRISLKLTTFSPLKMVLCNRNLPGTNQGPRFSGKNFRSFGYASGFCEPTLDWLVFSQGNVAKSEPLDEEDWCVSHWHLDQVD